MASLKANSKKIDFSRAVPVPYLVIHTDPPAPVSRSHSGSHRLLRSAAREPRPLIPHMKHKEKQTEPCAQCAVCKGDLSRIRGDGFCFLVGVGRRGVVVVCPTQHEQNLEGALSIYTAVLVSVSLNIRFLRNF